MFHTLRTTSPRVHAQVPSVPDGQIAAIAQKVRQAMVRGPVAGPVCGEASAAVTKALLNAGYAAEQVRGYVVGEPVGLLLDYFLHHHWTEVEGRIVDVTIDQLNRDGASYPPVMIHPRADSPEYLSMAEWRGYSRVQSWWCEQFVPRHPPWAEEPQDREMIGRSAAFHRAIAALPRAEREVVTRIYYGVDDWEEAANHLRLRKDTVIRRWHSARRRLRQALWLDRG